MEQDLKARVDDLVHTHASTLPDETRAALSEALLQLIEGELAGVRGRAVAVCLRRGDLWRETSLRGGRLAEESRARSNEALYLADLLETGRDLPEDESSGGGAAGGGIEARGLRG